MATELKGCECLCHLVGAGLQVTCTIDLGYSDVVPYCGPHVEGSDQRDTEAQCTRGCVDEVEGHRYPRRKEPGTGLCEPCANLLRRALLDTQTDYVLLPMVVQAGSAPAGDRVAHTKSDEAPVPVNLGVVALADDGRAGPARDPGDQSWSQETSDVPSAIEVVGLYAGQLRRDLDPSRKVKPPRRLPRAQPRRLPREQPRRIEKPTRDPRPRCEWSDLRVDECDHCRHGGRHEGVPIDHLHYAPPTPRGIVEAGFGQIDQPAPATTRSLVGEVNYLLAGFELLIGRPWVGQAMDEILAVRRALQRAHGWQPAKLRGDCLTVDARGNDCPGKVYEDSTGRQPKCHECGRIYSGRDAVRLAMQDGKRPDEVGPVRVRQPINPRTERPFPRQLDELPPVAVTHSGRSGVDQSVVVVGHHGGVLEGLGFDDEGETA